MSGAPSTPAAAAREVRLTGRGEAAFPDLLQVLETIQPRIFLGLTDDERATIIALTKKSLISGDAFSRAPLRVPQDDPAG